MTLRREVLALILILCMSASARAQQPGDTINFGGLRVQACAVSADPDYGITAAKPLQIGGGPAYADSRMTRYVGALRGPNGETIRILQGRGSLPAPLGYMDEPTILDAYPIEVGNQKMTLYVDDYHYSVPKAPQGLTCAGPLVVALGPPPVDPMLLARSLVRLAIEQGTAREVPPVPLDVSTPRGFLFDQFTMIAQRARAAAQGGMPMDPAKPPADVDPAGLVVLAVPMPCAGRTLLPQRIELTGPQGVIPQNGAFIKDEPLAKMFPGMKVPEDSIAGRFRQAQVSGVKIAYTEGCDATPAEVSLLIRLDTPRAQPRPPLPLPPGIMEAEPAVFFQVILDPAGQFSSPVYVGGPKSLLPAALEAVRAMRSDPFRLNGVGIQNPTILPIPFR